MRVKPQDKMNTIRLGNNGAVYMGHGAEPVIVQLQTTSGFGFFVNFETGEREQRIERGVDLSDGHYVVELSVHA